MDYHFVRIRKNAEEKNQPYLLHYISYKMIDAIKEGRAEIEGYNDDGTAIVVESEGHVIRPGSAWNISSHNAGTYGSEVIAKIIGEKRFTFPKSLYSVLDDLRHFTREKPNALILDFFAGSGTTLHAVNLLNAEDGGKRRCILVTNNEVSADEEKAFRAKGLKPGDEDWEKFGIAQYVTWPRTRCSILGEDVNGVKLGGDYGVEVEEYEVDDEAQAVSKVSGKPLKRKFYKKEKKQLYPCLATMRMSDGFKANAAFFKLGFVDPSTVSIGRAFKEILPLLWLKAGAHGPCPKAACPEDMLVCPENRFAVLMDECSFASFAKEVKQHPEIETLYFVTDYERSYKAMAARFPDKTPCQLYTDYLENFRVNRERK